MGTRRKRSITKVSSSFLSYGLLGASGCGKTTLLSCIVGRRRLNSGEIWVLGGKPGTKGSGVPGKQVGYMPQEIALYGEFTIRETMMYFGWIFGMCTSEIVERLRFLLQFLDLPSQNRLVKNLRYLCCRLSWSPSLSSALHLRFTHFYTGAHCSPFIRCRVSDSTENTSGKCMKAFRR
jgi:GTPase SAR1 family protein